MDFDDAVDLYHEVCEQQGMALVQPSHSVSKLIDGVWQLETVKRLLATVDASGNVHMETPVLQ